MRFPGDKSLAHRALLLAALARTPSRIDNLPDGDDVKRTVAALAALASQARPCTIDCGNSGTLARLLLGLCAGSDEALDVTLVGDASLSRRPMRRVAAPLAALLGRDLIELTPAGTLPARVRVPPAPAPARHAGARVVDTGVPSAQVKSALILAARKLAGDVTIREATATRDHTERMIAWLLSRPGASGALHAEATGAAVHMRGPLAWDGFDVELPGDPSSAALVAAYAIASGRAFHAEDLVLNARRAGFWRVLARMGIDVSLHARGERMGEPVGDVAVGARAAGGPRGEGLAAAMVTAAELPDLVDEVPALVVVALHAVGTTRIEGAGELRVKESDRLALLSELAHSFGGRADVEGDALVVHGPRARRCAGDRVHVRTDGDHRIAMAAQVLARLDGVQPYLDDDAAVHTSFPGFERALDSLDQQAKLP